MAHKAQLRARRHDAALNETALRLKRRSTYNLEGGYDAMQPAFDDATAALYAQMGPPMMVPLVPMMPQGAYAMHPVYVPSYTDPFMYAYEPATPFTLPRARPQRGRGGGAASAHEKVMWRRCGSVRARLVSSLVAGDDVQTCLEELSSTFEQYIRLWRLTVSQGEAYRPLLDEAHRRRMLRLIRNSDSRRYTNAARQSAHP